MNMVDFLTRKDQFWSLVHDEHIISAKQRRDFGLGPMGDAVETLVPPEMLRSRQGVAPAQLLDDTVGVANS